MIEIRENVPISFQGSSHEPLNVGPRSIEANLRILLVSPYFAQPPTESL